jgi:hypothetical protein
MRALDPNNSLPKFIPSGHPLCTRCYNHPMSRLQSLNIVFRIFETTDLQYTVLRDLGVECVGVGGRHPASFFSLMLLYCRRVN